MIEIPFERVGHFIRIPVELPDGSSARFFIDTGIGISVVSPSLARACGLAVSDRSYTGHRMSGQAVTVPLVDLPSLAVRGRGADPSSRAFGGFSGLAGIQTWVTRRGLRASTASSGSTCSET